MTKSNLDGLSLDEKLTFLRERFSRLMELKAPKLIVDNVMDNIQKLQAQKETR